MKLKALIVLLALAFAGCGGDNPDATTQAPQATAEQAPATAAPAREAAAPVTAPVADSQGDLGAPVDEQTDTSDEAAAVAPIVLAAATQVADSVSTRFQLGKDFQRLTPTQPTSSSPEQVEVAEVFWYGCSHCYNFDPYVGKWLTRKPDNVNFVRIPAVWNPLVKFHARAFYTAQALGKEEEMHTSFFREIHVNGNVLDTEPKLVEFFGRFGVSKDEFTDACNSYAVHTKLQQAETLARRYRVTSVPLVVVNGKYTTSASMTGGYDQLMEVIDDLVNVEGNAT
jgi:thiol:disulfide interchange protein DsbA